MAMAMALALAMAVALAMAMAMALAMALAMAMAMAMAVAMAMAMAVDMAMAMAMAMALALAMAMAMALDLPMALALAHAMAKIIDLQQNTPEWHEWRHYKIGGSDSASCCGMNKFCTPLQLYHRTLEKQERLITPRMARGSALEQKAREWVAKETGTVYEPICMEHEEIDYMIASLDGWNAEAPIKMIEIKCTNEFNHNLAKQGEVPAYYYPQCQHNMVVSDIDSMFYVSFDGENGVIVHVHRDEKFVKFMLEAEKKFYKCLVDLIPPEG
ncbi:MAG: YqaJ viral recombinase family protein [Simkania sp.]|nr:YqaJ viral recombinase family protein [Simkania sp.]